MSTDTTSIKFTGSDSGNEWECDVKVVVRLRSRAPSDLGCRQITEVERLVAATCIEDINVLLEAMAHE